MIVNLSNPKTSKTYTVKVDSPVYIGKKIGDEVQLEIIGVGGKGIITGGSTKEGMAMASFLGNQGHKRVLLTPGFGFKNSKVKGEKVRKTLHGTFVDERIAQINIKLVELKEDNLDAKFGKPKEEKKEWMW